MMQANNNQLPLLGIVAYSGTGKTTLLKKLIPLLKQKDLNIALLKHSHHDVDVDIPGKDSFELRKAGACQTMVACDNRWALMTETANQSVDIQYLITKFDQNMTDLVLVEGFKHEPFSKIALYRSAINKPLAHLIDQYTLAVASDERLNIALPLLDLNNPQQICDFITHWLQKR